MTPNYHTIRFSFFLMALFFIQGCVNLKPPESTARFYVLGAREHTETPSASSLVKEDSGISVGLRRLRLAAYLDTPYIVLRHGTNEVSFSENHRWGEDLEKAINRTIQTHLNSHASIRRIDAAPWPINTTHDYLLQIHVLQFEGQTDALLAEEMPIALEDQDVQVHLVANWQIIDPNTNDVIHQEKTDVLLGGWNTDIYSNLVSGLDHTLKAMASDIAATLEAIERDGA
ncbi:MAG: PqiC family protein [Rhodothermaceae bacterium]|nr:PqiC family protein [Rhodothermaceae bacterium]